MARARKPNTASKTTAPTAADALAVVRHFYVHTSPVARAIEAHRSALTTALQHEQPTTDQGLLYELLSLRRDDRETLALYNSGYFSEDEVFAHAGRIVASWCHECISLDGGEVIIWDTKRRDRAPVPNSRRPAKRKAKDEVHVEAWSLLDLLRFDPAYLYIPRFALAFNRLRPAFWTGGLPQPGMGKWERPFQDASEREEELMRKRLALRKGGEELFKPGSHPRKLPPPRTMMKELKEIVGELKDPTPERPLPQTSLGRRGFLRLGGHPDYVDAGAFGLVEALTWGSVDSDSEVRTVSHAPRNLHHVVAVWDGETRELRGLEKIIALYTGHLHLRKNAKGEYVPFVPGTSLGEDPSMNSFGSERDETWEDQATASVKMKDNELAFHQDLGALEEILAAWEQLKDDYKKGRYLKTAATILAAVYRTSLDYLLKAGGSARARHVKSIHALDERRDWSLPEQWLMKVNSPSAAASA